MAWLVHELAPRLPAILAVLTLLLAAGCACIATARSPAHRQRVGELTVAAVVAWLLLAMVPMPRVMPLSHSGEATPAGGLQADTDRFSIGSAASIVAVEQTQLQQKQSIDSSGQNDDTELKSLLAGVSAPPPSGSVAGPTAGSQSIGAAAIASDPRSPNATQDVARPFGWREIGAAIYLAAAAIAAAWLLIGHAILVCERFAADAPPPWLYRILQSAAKSCGRPPKLLISRRCGRPVSWGIFRPVIMLPERLCRSEHANQLKTVLLHELSHIRRRDARGNLLFEIALPMLVGHPLFWWLKGQTQLAAELVADDWAAAQTGKEIYAAELVALAKSAGPRRLSFASATGALSSQSQFYRRMKMLLARERPLATRVSKAWKALSIVGLAGCVGIATALVGIGPATGQQTESAIRAAAPAKETKEAAANGTPGAAVDPLSGSTSKPVQEKPASDNSVGLSNSSTPLVGTVSTAGNGGTASTTSEMPTAARETAATGVFTTTPPKPVPGNGPGSAAPVDERAKMAAEIESLQAQLELLKSQAAKLDDLSRARADLARMAEQLKAQAAQLSEAEIHNNYKKLPPAPKPAPAEGANPFGAEPKQAVVRPLAVISGSASGGKQTIVLKNLLGPAPMLNTYELNPDGTIGRLIESRSAGAEEPKKIEPYRIQTPASGTANVMIDGKSVSMGPALPAARAVDEVGIHAATQPLDLVALATSYSDAVSAVEQAQTQLDNVEKMAAVHATELQAVAPARAALQAAERKARLLRRIVEVATTNARKDYQRMETLHANGGLSGDVLQEYETRVEILKQILSAGQTVDPTKSSDGSNSPAGVPATR